MTRTVYRRFDASAENGHLSALEDRFLPLLSQLAADLLLARVRGDDPWQNAPTLADLTRTGLTASDCVALIRRGILTALPFPTGKSQGKSANEPSPSGRGQGEGGVKSGRSQKSSRSVTRTKRPPRPGPRTRLLLTDVGLAVLTKHVQSSRVVYRPLQPGDGRGEGVSDKPSAPGSTAHEPRPTAHAPRPTQVDGASISPSSLLPHYDIELRELTVAGEVILRLPVQAHNLAAILTSLERASWKSRVEKPLNGRPDGSDPTHLADAAYSLNGRQPLIDFHADGGAVRWQWRQKAELPQHPLHNGKPKAAARRNSRRVRQENRGNVD